MKKFILPIAAIAALTAMAVAMSAIVTPQPAMITPTLASEADAVVPPVGTKEIGAEDDCCAKPEKAVIAVEKMDCDDCDKTTAKKEECDDCEEHIKDTGDSSTL